MYGGAPTSLTEETWSYDYATDRWTEIETRTRPGAVGDHAMAYDPSPMPFTSMAAATI